MTEGRSGIQASLFARTRERGQEDEKLEPGPMKRHTILSLPFLLLVFLTAAPAQSQLLSVTGEYRVVEVDRAEQRVGVALRDADPDKRQNWVVIKPGTKIIQRKFLKGGVFRDEVMTFNGFFDYVKKGTKFRVEGGRDWDRSIHAKKIWL